MPAAASHRVLHLIHSPQRRGAEVFAAQLATQLEASGRFQNGVCSLYPAGDTGLPLDGLPVFKLNGRRGIISRLGVEPGMVSGLSSVLRRFRPHVVLAHGSDTLKYAVVARFFPGLFINGSTPTVYRNIGLASSWATTPMKVRFNRMFLGRVNAVVSVSQFTRTDFIRLYRFPPERVTFIPNGVDVAPFAAAEPAVVRGQVRQELGIDSKALVLISVGNLSAEKGHLDLLPMLAQFDQHVAGIQLVLVGDGPLRGQLMQQAGELGVAQRLHLLGRRDDVPRLLAAADVFVLPSRTEGMPAVLIEAGLAGLPAVAFWVGGVGEVVGEGVTGMLAPPGDHARFQQAVAALAGDSPRRAAMGQAARKRCGELFDIRRVAEAYEELLAGLISSKCRHS